MEGVPTVPPKPSLSGSALGLWGQHPVQHAQYRPVAIASLAVILRGGLHSSSSSLPSISRCHAATGCLKRTALQQADFSACCQLIYQRQSCPAAAPAFLTPQQKLFMLSAGITKVAHLRLSLQLQQPQLLVP